MSENQRETPTELANKRIQELETAKATKDLNDAMSNLSKKGSGDLSKEDMFKAMHEMTKQIKLNESKTIDSVTSAAIQTALDVSMQMKTLDDPRLRRQAMITLKTINDNIKLSEDSSKNNVDEAAVKRNLVVAIDNLKTESLMSRIADKMSQKQGVVGDAMDTAGPIFGLMKDTLKKVSGAIASKKGKDESPTFLDHQIERKPIKDMPKPVALPPVQVKERDEKQLTVPVSVPSTVQAPTVIVRMDELKSDMHAVKEADESILEHIKDISAVMKEQLIMAQDQSERDNAHRMEGNFRKFKVKGNNSTNQQPTQTQPEGKSGGLLDFITPLLFGSKGLMKTLMRFVLSAGGLILSMLNPKNIWKFAKGAVTVVTDLAGKIFGKLGSLFDDMGGVLGKIGKFGKLAKGIPYIGQIIAVVFGIFDFFNSFMNADEVLGKAKEAITLWDRVSAGLGGFIGGIVGIADSILGLFGIETDMGGFVKEKIAGLLSNIPDLIVARFEMLLDLKDTIAQKIDSGLSAIKGGFQVFIDILDDISSFTSNLGPTLKKMFTEKARQILNVLPGDLGDKLLPTEEKPKQKEDKEEKPENKKPEEQNFVQRALSNLPSLSDIFGKKDDKEKKEKEAALVAAQNNSTTNVNNVSNMSSSNTNIYQSMPIATRPSDDSFRVI